MPQATAEPAIKAYWQPGCTSCLRMKEFLTKHGVPFVSVNVLADKGAFDELAELGLRTVPIVRRGKDWAKAGLEGCSARGRHQVGRGEDPPRARARRPPHRYPAGGTAVLRLGWMKAASKDVFKRRTPKTMRLTAAAMNRAPRAKRGRNCRVM